MIETGPTPSTELHPARTSLVQAPAVDPHGIELREALQILWRRRLVIACALATGILVAILSIVFAQNRYSATATIEVNRENGSSLGFTDLSGAASALGDTEGLNLDLLTQQAVILSDNTALRVIEDLRLDLVAPYAIAESPHQQQSARAIAERGLSLEQAPLHRASALRAFRSRLRVAPIKGTRLLTVTFTDTDPNRAATIANAVVEAYTSESTRARFQASSKASAWLTGQLADLKHRVEDSQARVDAFQRTSGLVGVAAVESRAKQPGGEVASGSDNVALSRLIELNRDLTSAEVTRIAREAAFAMAQTHDPDVVLGIGSGPLAGDLGPDSPLAPGSPDRALVEQLRQQLVQVRVQLATATTKYGAKNPVITQLTAQQASLEMQIRAELDRVRSRAKSDRDLAALNEEGIRRQIAQQERAVNEVTEKSGRLLLLEEEARSSREIYQDLYTKLEEASVTAGIKASNVTLVSPARTPAFPSFPRKRMTMALGCAAGAVLGLLVAFTLDYFDDSIAMPEDAERITGLPVIGAIPDFHRKRNRLTIYGADHRQDPTRDNGTATWLVRNPRSQIAEAYRALRTALHLAQRHDSTCVVLITSGSAEEGKSTTCLNTAAAFAVQGDRVLYLDADLRRAKGHTLFGCSNEIGLSNCLASGLAFPAALKSHPQIATLFLLPAGSHVLNPSELLGSRRFADLLAELRPHFDYVFIDTPPLLLVTDAQLISPHADGCVLVLRAQKTSKQCLRRSLALMRATKTPMFGLVMNAFKTQMSSYSGDGYYGKGSGYYAEG